MHVRDVLPAAWPLAPRRLLPILIATAVIAISPPALASFNGRLDLGPGLTLLIAAAFSLPGAVLCAIIEWIGARRRPPTWVGALAAGLGIFCGTRALGWDPRGDAGYFLLAVPPLLTLALVALIPAPRPRLVAVWVTSLLGLWLVAVALNSTGADPSDVAALPIGGALVTLPLWQLVYLLRQASLRRAGITPVPGPDFKAALSRVVAALWQARETARSRPPGSALQQGLHWLVGGAGVFYVGVALITAMGYETFSFTLVTAEWRVTQLFGLPGGPARDSPTRTWALHGLPWSLLAGCLTWGWAACAGMFDAGRLARLRLAAAVLPVMLFAVLIATATHGFL
ncbi:MAG: hypothetical protein ABI831_14195 [Betaproteobacteria bacterium]